MLKSILKLQMVNPISVGLGGPFCGLLHSLTGIHKVLPFWALCPLWCLLFAPIILLCPILLPIYVVSILQKVYRQHDVYYYLPPEELTDTAPSLDSSDDRFRYTYLENAISPQLGKIKSTGENAEKRPPKIKGFKSSFVYGSLGKDDDDDDKLYRYHVVGFIQQNIKSNLLQYKNLILFSQLVYWICVALISYGIVYFSFLAFQEYHLEAMKNRTLQIATPEQLEYADRIVAIFTTGGMLIWATLLFIIAVTFTSAIGCFNPTAVARKILLKNFLPLVVVSCLLCSVGNLTERYYAHYVLIAYEDIILGREYFNPAYLFIAIRCLIVYVFCMGLSLTMLMSLRLLPLSFKSPAAKAEQTSEDADPADADAKADANEKSNAAAANAKNIEKADSASTSATMATASQHSAGGLDQGKQSSEPQPSTTPQGKDSNSQP